MAVAPQLSPFELVDLRQLRARELAPLLEEERRLWAEELHWDHRPSAEMIRKHVEARTLPGVAALIHGRVAGYSFHILDDTKGIIGEPSVLRGPPGGPACGKKLFCAPGRTATPSRWPRSSWTPTAATSTAASTTSTAPGKARFASCTNTS